MIPKISKASLPEKCGEAMPRIERFKVCRPLEK
jgi:hypothetical protein